MHKVLISCFLLFAISFSKSESSDLSQGQTMLITALGEVITLADMAKIRLTIRSSDSSATKLRQEIGVTVIRLLDSLNTFNKSVLQIDLGQLREYSHTECSNSKPVTVVDVTKEITLTINDLSKLDTILFKAEQCGAKISTDIDWKHSKVDSLTAIAVDKACQSARQKATLYASKFGIRIGKILKVEPDYYQPQIELLSAHVDLSKALFQGIAITIQNVKIISRVSVTYEIKN